MAKISKRGADRPHTRILALRVDHNLRISGRAIASPHTSLRIGPPVAIEVCEQTLRFTVYTASGPTECQAPDLPTFTALTETLARGLSTRSC